MVHCAEPLDKDEGSANTIFVVQLSTPTRHNSFASLRAVWKHIFNVCDTLPTNRRKTQMHHFHMSGLGLWCL